MTINKEILSRINKSSARFLQEGAINSREVCQHIVNTLPGLLGVDNHPTLDEEEKGNGDCTTAYKYFEESVRYLLPAIQISPRIVQRSVWEPSDKRANIHVIAEVIDKDEVYQVDATHYPGAGYGQVHSGPALHITQSLTTRDMQIIDRVKYVKHLYAKGFPNAECEALQIFSLEIPRHMNSWMADLELIALNHELERGLSAGIALDRLRVIVDLNPYKAGVLKTVTRLSESMVESEKFTGIRTLVEDNMKRLRQTASSSANGFFYQARGYFKSDAIKPGFQCLSLSWLVGNIAKYAK